MTGSVKPYCFGRGCGLKQKCCRYKEHIDVKAEDHFPFSPNKKEDECGFFVGIKPSEFIEQLKTLKNGRATSNPDGES